MTGRERYMRLRGDGENATRYRANREDTRVHLYVDVRGKYTLLDLLAFAAEQGALAQHVTFTGGCFMLDLPATPEDVARWEKYDADREERDRKARRAAFERLRAEFEGESDD